MLIYIHVMYYLPCTVHQGRNMERTCVRVEIVPEDSDRVPLYPYIDRFRRKTPCAVRRFPAQDVHILECDPDLRELSV